MEHGCVCAPCGWRTRKYMKKDDAYDILCEEYLSKCNTCDECVAEYYCIENNLRDSKGNCVEKIKGYFRNR